MDKKNEIVGNPSFAKISSTLQFIRVVNKISDVLIKLKIKPKSVISMKQQTDDLLNQAEILTIPDRFNAAFSSNGWIATDSFSLDVMKRSVELAERDNKEAAEIEILEWFTKDTINLFAITRANQFHKVHGRFDQLHEALKLFIEERYMAAVPLILIACDGFASEILKGKSPFDKEVDLSCFDTISGHATSLPALIKKITKSVGTSSDEEMTIPLRHGILHGRSLGYANKTVCAKAWLLMIALVDWAVAKADEEKRKENYHEEKNITLKDVFRQLLKTQKARVAIDEWHPIERVAPFNEPTDPSLPEYAMEEFLSAWQNKNYGKMANRAMNFADKTITKLAGELRRDTEFVELTAFEILRVKQSTVCRADVRINAKAKTLTQEVDGDFDMLMFKYLPDGELSIFNESEGKWRVQQGFIFKIMRGKACVPTRGVRGTCRGLGHRERSDRRPSPRRVLINEVAIACLR